MGDEAESSYMRAIREATGIDELFSVLERHGPLHSGEKTYDVDEAEERISTLARYTEEHGYDRHVDELLGDITPAYGLRDTVKRLLGSGS